MLKIKKSFGRGQCLCQNNICFGKRLDAIKELIKNFVGGHTFTLIVLIVLLAIQCVLILI
jgi:hypothetical protein